MNFKKTIAVALLLCLAFCIADLGVPMVSAADSASETESGFSGENVKDDGYFDVVYEANEDYKNSRFYQNLRNIPKSGNQAEDTVAIALSQVGYHEGDGDSDFGGMNTNGKGDFVEYNMLFGKVDNNVGYGYAWCASFATWCMRQAGVTDSQSAQTDKHAYISCRKWMEGFKEAGNYHSVEEKYKPEIGDVIFFKDVDDPTVKTTTTHVGIVLFADKANVYTIEGNTNTKMGKEPVSDSVTIKTHPLDSKYIVGYGSPEYEKNGEEALVGWRLASDPSSSPEHISERFDEIRGGEVAIPVFARKSDVGTVEIVCVSLVALALVGGITALAVMTFKKKPDDRNSGRRREIKKSRNKYR